jgi:hypothetical protein
VAFAENLAPLFADFGSAAVVGAASGRVLFDRESQAVFDGLALDAEESATMATTTFPTLANGDTIVITGRGTFTVREVRLIDDGALKRATLKRVS